MRPVGDDRAVGVEHDELDVGLADVEDRDAAAHARPPACGAVGRSFVIPANAGIQSLRSDAYRWSRLALPALDARVRGHDEQFEVRHVTAPHSR